MIGTCKYAANDKATFSNVTVKEEKDMKTDEFVTALNDSNAWTRNDKINNGYPILKTIKYKEN